MRKEWTKEEIKYLIDNYSDYTSSELSIYLNRTEKSIYIKGHKLGLHKSKQHISKMITKRNKMVGRDLSFDLCKNEALKYKTRGEFQFKDSSIYTVSRTKGWLNSICSHMIKINYSIPQMILTEILKVLFIYISSNDKTITKPYELDIYIPRFKLAFEYDGKRWHRNNQNDELKNRICIENNIKLIRIIENNRNYESDIKKQLITNLVDINTYCNTNITKEMILDIRIDNIFDDILDNNEIIKITKEYNNYTVFKKENQILFYKLYRLKLLNKYTNHMSRKQWSDSNIEYLIKNYSELPLDELIINLNKNKESIYLKANRLGLKKRGN